MNPFNLIFKLISIGAGLLCAGSLLEIVVDLEKRAAHDTEVDIISIGNLNRRLHGEVPPQTTRHKHHKRLCHDLRIFQARVTVDGKMVARKNLRPDDASSPGRRLDV